MPTIPNKIILEQKMRVEYVVGLFNKAVSAPFRVNARDYDHVDIESTVPTSAPNSVPRHIATVVGSIGAVNAEDLQFEISDHEFSTLEGLTRAMNANKNQKTKTSLEADPRFLVKCDPKITEVPALLMSNGLSDLMPTHGGLKANTTLLVFECPCRKNYFCSSINAIFAKGQDISHWKSRIRNPKPGHAVTFFVAVPVVNYILYSVPVEVSIMTDWDDKQVKKYMTYGINEDVTTFFDDPFTSESSKVELHMLHDQIVNVTLHIQEVMQEKLGDEGYLHHNFVNSTCRNPHHNYGTNRKVMEFMSSRPDATLIAIACFELYGMCPHCYINANPIFSLLDTNLF